MLCELVCDVHVSEGGSECRQTYLTSNEHVNDVGVVLLHAGHGCSGVVMVMKGAARGNGTMPRVMNGKERRMHPNGKEKDTRGWRTERTKEIEVSVLVGCTKPN